MFSSLLYQLYESVKPVKVESVFEVDKCPYGNFENLQSLSLAREAGFENGISYGRLTELGEDIYKRDVKLKKPLSQLRRILFNI